MTWCQCRSWGGSPLAPNVLLQPSDSRPEDQEPTSLCPLQVGVGPAGAGLHRSAWRGVGGERGLRPAPHCQALRVLRDQLCKQGEFVTGGEGWVEDVLHCVLL